ncbi:MAG: hypothetical protein WDZ69_01550 [Candidatus Pacearchaeota archaeon]
MKAKIKEFKEVEKEIEVGKKGDPILLRPSRKLKRRDHHIFGILEGIVDDYFIGGMGGGKHVPAIKFSGNSYKLSFSDVIGVEIPELKKRMSSGWPLRHYQINQTEEIISGFDKIIKYLDNYEDTRFKGHADLIRKVKDNYNTSGNAK